MNSSTEEKIIREWTDENGIRRRERVVTKTEVEPHVHLDWVQVKSGWKAKAKRNRALEINPHSDINYSTQVDGLTKTVQGCYVGILQAWHRPSKLSGSFELLENIRCTPRTKEIVSGLVSKAMSRLRQTGFESLVVDVAKKEPVIKFMMQLLAAGREAGLQNLHPWHVPRIREAISDRLSNRLYTISQGSGIKVPSAVCRMDDTVPEGCVVVSNRDGTWMSEGQNVGLYRFPIVLPMGVRTYKTINPPDHCLVNGKMSPFTIVINPRDCSSHNGDDDGDIFGIVTDPVTLELFQNRLDNLQFAIEPEGVEVLDSKGGPLLSASDEGIEYLLHDHRGPVGRCTVWRSRLLAIGDEEGARGISVSIQECIDQAKRKPRWSDPRKATSLAAWTLRDNGWYGFDHKLDPEACPNGEFPMDLIKGWIDARLIEAGCFTIEINDRGEEYPRAADPLWWRYEGKKIDIENWVIPDAEGAQFENLVHWSARETYRQWKSIEAGFKLPPGEVPMGLLLPIVLKTRGIEYRILEVNKESYAALKEKSGLSDYNNKLGTILNLNDYQDDEERKYELIARAQVELEKTLIEKWNTGELTLSEIVTLWVHECDESNGGKVNNAFRLVCYENSPILEMLGVAEPTKCQFLSRGSVNRVDYLVKTAMKSPEPFETLKDLIGKSKRHHEGFTSKDGTLVEAPICNEDGTTIALHQCLDCMTQLQDGLVRALRNTKTDRELEFLKKLKKQIDSNLNKILADAA